MNGCSKERLEQFKKILSDNMQRREKNIEGASRINKAQFKKYEPLFEDVRTYNRAAMFGFFLINLRRSVMLIMAMSVHSMGWV